MVDSKRLIASFCPLHPWPSTSLSQHSPPRLQHSMGPSCVEASLSASRRCHRNLISHRRLWAPSMRIYVVFTQRKMWWLKRKATKNTHPQIHAISRPRKWQHLIWKFKKLHRERGYAGARVSLCINNSFYLIMHFQKLALLIKMVSGCSQVRLRPRRALFHGLLYLNSSALNCFKSTLGKHVQKFFPKRRESDFKSVKLRGS